MHIHPANTPTGNILAPLHLLYGLLAVCAGPLAASPAALAAEEYARVMLADSPRGIGWSDVAKDGAHTYRTTQAGKPTLLALPAWWGEGIRPPQGKIYILEVTYRDVLPGVAICESTSGLGQEDTQSELHRFGGVNDGQWKVAQVPVSWDLIRLRKGSRTAEVSFRAPAEMPVEKIVIRDAHLPDDQARWEDESRAWVARQQQAQAAKVDEAPGETPVIPEAWKGQALVPFARAYYHWVLPHSAPRAGEAGAAVRVRLARNESESGAFGVYVQEALHGVTYTISDLTGPGGKLACEVECLTAEYALEASSSGKLSWTPQRLWHAFPVEIRKGQSAWFYFNVKTLGVRSQPGTYTGRIVVTSGAHTAELPLTVDVLPITLLTMEQADLRMAGYTTGLPTFGELETLAAYNHNMIGLWFTMGPPMTIRDGRLQLDFSLLDEWMGHAKASGIGSIVWFLGGNPNGFPCTLTIERDIYQALGKPRDEFFQRMGAPEQRGQILPEVAAIYREWVKLVAAHAREKGWPELILTPFDEPAKWASETPKPEKRAYAVGCGPWIRDHFKAACQLIHEAAPGTRIYISMHHNDNRDVHGVKGRIGEIFIPDVDVVCSNAIEEDAELGNKTRKAGRAFWQYSGSASRRYGFGFYFGAWNSRGMMTWAYNWGRRFDLTDGRSWEYGYYSPFATVVSPTYVEIREACDDRRYLETAKATAKAAGRDISGLIARIRQETLAEHGGGGRDTVNDFWEAGKRPERLDAWRQLLADEIITMSNTSK